MTTVSSQYFTPEGVTDSLFAKGTIYEAFPEMDG